MKYKTEMHCHTKYVSRFCATVDAKSIVEQYLDYGYSTVVITDHMSRRIFEGMDDISPRERMEYFISGYREVKKYAGDRLNVLLGAEINFAEMGHSDYLIYGPTEDYFLNNPDMYLHDRFWNGGLVKNNDNILIQAHPFRRGCAVTEDFVIQGIEVYNGHPTENSHNRIAEEWLKEFPNYIVTSGSDHHDEDGYPDAGILTDVPITDNRQLVAVLRSGEYELIRDDETREKAIRAFAEKE